MIKKTDAVFTASVCIKEKKMEKIASFCVDHTKIEPGMYVSRIDGDVITYDIRMKKPNGGNYLEMPAAHTMEHLFATFARNSKWGKEVVYVGPMGCRTGFYLLTRDTVPHDDAITLVKQSMDFIAGFEGDIPGATEIECGNFQEQDLQGAKKEASQMKAILQNWKAEQLTYQQ